MVRSRSNKLGSNSRTVRIRTWSFPFLVLLPVSLCQLAFGAFAADYGQAIRELSNAAESEVREGRITGATIALVDDQQIVFVRGFGFADKKRRIPARPDTIYRAGSISKLFTAVATMQLVEQGRLDLDSPVTRYLPNFSVIVPFDNAKPITLRQLMSHRSGMVREAPVGGYFDDSEPGMDKTVASLASCALTYPPTTRTKYSNSGVTTVGKVVEQISGTPFPIYQQKQLLAPLGMSSSAFLRNATIRRKLATGYLPVANGAGGFREIDAPVFEFGILAAGNLYTTAEDLSRFISFLFADGRAGGQQLLRSQTLAEMFTPQLTSDTNGFGLGFSIGHFRGRKTVNHMGAVYGFTSILTAIPSEKIGVVVLCNDDIAIGPVRRLNAAALDLMFSAKTGEAATKRQAALAVNADQLRNFVGSYESQSYWAQIDGKGAELIANISGQKLALTPTAALKFEGNGRVAYNAPFIFERDSSGKITGFSSFEQNFHRIDPGRLPTAHESWKPFLGAYGPAFIPLIISAKFGHLYATTENEFDYRLTPINGSVFQMPPGMYEGEQIVFQPNRHGKVHRVVFANMPLRRR